MKIINHRGKVKPKGKVSVCLTACYPLRTSPVACTSIYPSTYSRTVINTQPRIIMFQAGRKCEIPGGRLFFPLKLYPFFGTE